MKVDVKCTVVGIQFMVLGVKYMVVVVKCTILGAKYDTVRYSRRYEVYISRCKVYSSR